MAEDMYGPINSNSAEEYHKLNIDDAPQDKNYHNLGHLTFVTCLLCISTYFYGFILTNLATFSPATI